MMHDPRAFPSPLLARPLLATEGTSFDAGAERVAIELAARCGLALAAVLPIESSVEAEAWVPERQRQTERSMAQRLDRLTQAARQRGVRLDGVVRRGDELHREILDHARERSSDLIIIRRRGERGFLAQLLVGETVHKVIRATPCPVLVVPAESAYWSRRILLAGCGELAAGQSESLADARAAQLAVQLAACSAIALDVLHLREGQDRRDAAAGVAPDALAQRAAKAGVELHHIHAAGGPVAAILDAVRRSQADLVVLACPARPPATLKVAAAEQVAGSAGVPVLIVRP